MSDPLVGEQLDEYILEKLLGQGGMARVYRALDIGLHRYAAIKVIDTPHQQDTTYISRFEREAQAIARLYHPHIVTLYRYGNTSQVLYLAMQYIEGADLHAVLSGFERDREFMEFDDVARLLSEIAMAIDYAHTHGVIHRDIKPSNILLDADGRAYLTDFGLALLADEGTRGEILGSPRYIAPEQAASSAGAVNESDVYSLGVILYRMLTGKVPFEHGDTLGLLTQHITKEPPPPRELRPDISPALEAVVLKALAKKPADRYATAREMAEAAAQAMKEEPAAPSIPSAASTLSIMDRVALNMEALPPASEAVAAMTRATRLEGGPAETTPTARSPLGDTVPSAGRRRLPARWIAAGALILVALAVAWLLWGRGEEEPAGSAVPLPTPLLPEATATTEAAALPPSREPIPTVTAVAVVAEPSATEPLPTEAAAAETTSPPPTSTSPPATAAPTATPSGPRLVMFYDATSFYVYNPNRDMNFRVSDLLFESLDAQGEPVGYWFDGRRWSQFYSFLEPFGCVSLEVAREEGWLRPSQCRVTNALITPDQGDDAIFWSERPGVSQFRVLWQGAEIGRCQVSDGQCDAYLP